MLARIRKAQENGEGGFTLIELLVVVVIIGILSAIAIPTFLKQREKAWDKAMKADLHNNAIKMEEALDDLGSYPTSAPAAGSQYAFKVSDSNGPTSVASGTTILAAGGFCIQATSTKLKDSAGAFVTQHLLSTDGKPSSGACPTA